MRENLSGNLPDTLSFGPFVLTAAPRGLWFGTQAVELEHAALELLATIARSAHGATAAQLWPLVSGEPAVDEEQLGEWVGRVNTALGRCTPAWYIAWYPDDEVPRFALVDATRRSTAMAALPAPRTDIIGREDAIQRVVAELRAHRFVTVLAAGGMGKTTVALAAAHLAASEHPDGVHFIDLAPFVDAELAVQGVATALGCAASGVTALAALQRWASGRRALFVLDSCEHLIEATAQVAEALLGAGPAIAVLATSREPLRASGEWLYRLAPMRLPQPGELVSASQALAFPALRLFIERAGVSDTSGAGFALDDADVPLLVALCTRLDGIALAIEIVAARAAALGLAALAHKVEQRLLQLPGPQTAAPARHTTLSALLDWSYQLLSPGEQQVLRRLAVFRNGFTLDAANEVAVGPGADATVVQEDLLDLVAKSLVAPVRGSEPGRLRLLDTTRAYAGAKLDEAGERNAVSRRHALWLASALAEAERSWDGISRAQWLARYAPLIDDSRAALDWAFTPGGDVELGIELTLSSFALARQMLLVDEFTRRVEQTMEALVARGMDPAAKGPGAAISSQHMRLIFLVGCLGTGGSARMQALVPVLKSLAAAQPDASSLLHRFSAFNSMWALSVAQADFRSAGEWADRLSQTAELMDDPVADLVAGRIQAQNQHFMGRHVEATAMARRVLHEAWRTIPLAYNPSPVELRVSMRVVLARSLWMQGFPERAAAMASEAMAQSLTDSPIAQCQAIVMGSMPVALWSGLDDTAHELLTQVTDVETIQGFGYWLRWGKRFGDVLSLRAGSPLPAMQDAAFFDEPDWILADHLATLDERWLSPACVQRVEAGMVGWCTPEVLRRQGERALREATPASQARGEDLLQRSLALARQQGTASWELRTATSLARHWQARDRAHKARALLEPVLARFTEGFETADWRDARGLLAALS
ncbi:MAG TPA: hypothetical protein VLA61_11040 [Ideonella sp.]|uniref:ATP-binding protein n=1 Tax=Ideonella sp. TaxID=1929293 RepID=UPI002C629198|nr:hypothetical protein [Ideonella sp.]HSI48798.1 hypothetical protein [Ideonella sp.]